MLKMILAVAVISASGCSLIESDAGKSEYSYTRTDPDGTKHEISIHNAKNIGLVSAVLKTEGLEVELIEEGVDASNPMKIMAEQNSRLIEKLLTPVGVVSP